MDTTATEQPLKVCRHCSVASRTEADTCPSCGKPYERQLWRWRWWMAIPIVVLAFAGGYYGLSELIWDDEEATTITESQAMAVPDNTTEDQLAARLGGIEPAIVRSRKAGAGKITCHYYKLDEEDAVWEFCFTADKALVTSVKVGGEGGVTPIPPGANP